MTAQERIEELEQQLKQTCTLTIKSKAAKRFDIANELLCIARTQCGAASLFNEKLLDEQQAHASTRLELDQGRKRREGAERVIERLDGHLRSREPKMLDLLSERFDAALAGALRDFVQRQDGTGKAAGGENAR